MTCAVRRAKRVHRLTTPRNILIAGYGFVGRALGRRLVERGHRIWGLKRTPASPPDGVEIITADLGDSLDPARLPERIDHVVYLLSSKEGTDAAYRRARVDALAHLIEALTARRTGPARLLFASSTGVYAQTDGSWVNEETPAAPNGSAGRILLEGESLALSAPFPTTVVRFSGIYGPGRLRLLRMIARGEPTWAEGPPVFSNRIHVEDCAAVLEHLLALESPRDLYVASDDEPVDRRELAHWLAAALGVPSAPPLPPEARSRWGNKRCSNACLKASGYRFLYPTFREGYREIIQDELEI